MKRFLSLMVAVAMLFAIVPAVYADEATDKKEEHFVEYRLDQYYSRSLPVFNIATGHESNYIIISAPSLPNNATITKVKVRGRKTGGQANWIVLNETGGAMRPFSNTTVFDEFYGETADTDWAVYITGDNWTTVRGSTFKVYYRY